jgi:hypothetical protein
MNKNVPRETSWNVFIWPWKSYFLAKKKAPLQNDNLAFGAILQADTQNTGTKNPNDNFSHKNSRFLVCRTFRYANVSRETQIRIA